MTKNRHMVKWLLLLLIASSCVYMALYGPKVFAINVTDHESVSPDGRYRLEYLKPGFPYLLSLTKDMPRIVRLYDNQTGKLLGESQTVELSGNGKIFWPTKLSPYILVGNSINFPIKPE